jgi:hypothetical protein
MYIIIRYNFLDMKKYNKSLSINLSKKVQDWSNFVAIHMHKQWTLNKLKHIST